MNRRMFGSAMIGVGVGVGVAHSDYRHGSAWLKVSRQARPSGAKQHGDVFRQGDTAPATGIYDVVHGKLDGDDHCPPHQVTAEYGDTFPPCRLCQGSVRFRPHQAPEHVKVHQLFKT